MCGIVGFTGKKRAAPVLVAGLKRLEYRGYDSAGLAVLEGGQFHTVKKKGRVKQLDDARAFAGNTGIGHTRWATHGAPSARNAHPHVWGKFAVVHNGIVENYLALKQECLDRGETFASDTDSEVIAHLVAACYAGNFLAAVRNACGKLEGSYAVAVLCTDYPDSIVCARKSSPLVAGKGKDGLYVASDIPAIAAEGTDVFVLGEGEYALLQGEDLVFYDGGLNRISKQKEEYDLSVDVPDKMGYRHYMRKEMSEIPEVLLQTKGVLEGKDAFSDLFKVLCHAEYIQIVACGTAYHSGLCAKYAIESLCRIPVEVYVASEYRYLDPIVKEGTAAIAVSQSGETADTLAAAELAKERGAYLVAVTNVPYSSLTRIADCVLPTCAGREIAVAATKSFNAQLALLYGLAARLAKIKGKEVSFPDLSGAAGEALAHSEDVRSWTPYFIGAKSVYFIGRGADRCAALEGSLKLKEISYLPGEGYAAGELKHGTLALIDAATPVVAVLTQRSLAEKTMNAVHEVYARGAKVFLITSIPEYCARKEVTASVLVPECREEFSPVLSVIPLQMLAYYTAIARGNDPDKPRNLAKSVTVE